MKELNVSSGDLLRPIPVEVPSTDGWETLPIEENDEPLVALGPFSPNDDIFTSSVYYGEHSHSPYIREANQLDGTLITMFVRLDVAESLRHAQSLLPERHYLIVLDSYRSFEVQSALYEHYYTQLAAMHPDWTPQMLEDGTKPYVSAPSLDPAKPSPHNTGGSTDVAIFELPEEVDEQVVAINDRLQELKQIIPADPTPEQEAYDPDLRAAYLLEMQKIGLIRRHAKFLDFGASFDHGGPSAAVNHFELLDLERPLSSEEQVARDNRRLLYNAMVAAGMQPLKSEWWHYNSGKSQMGARSAGRDSASYGGAIMSESNLTHETMRTMHHRGLVRIHESLLQGDALPASDTVMAELLALNGMALSIAGDPRLTRLPQAAVIAPSAL
ncbi:MAG: hypothetical protein JWM37_492 [Candidatus Saccharibacteria bacterium]|nr:hypothetical protein [Candidatus Saccharibacteria bacterium]